MEIPDNVKPNLNQNLWGLVVAWAALGASEYYGLRFLFYSSLVISLAMSLSILFTLLAYTVSYWRQKMSSS